MPHDVCGQRDMKYLHIAPLRASAMHALHESVVADCEHAFVVIEHTVETHDSAVTTQLSAVNAPSGISDTDSQLDVKSATVNKIALTFIT